jgi:hypothetical protein
VNEKLVEEALDRLRSLRDGAKEPWEKAAVDLFLGLVSREGMDSLYALGPVLSSQWDFSGGVPGVIGRKMTLRETSDLLALLESAEADRRAKVAEILGKVLTVVKIVAEELLKIALGRAT